MSSRLGKARIGLIGAGTMGEALAAGLVASGVPATRVRASDPDPRRRDHLSRSLGIRVQADNAPLVAESDIVVLAVKPAAVAPVLADLSRAIEGELERPLWISIAAGVRLSRLEAALPSRARIVRAMPNTAARVRAAASAFIANREATPQDREQARALLETVGSVWEAPEEDLLDAVTGLSGSGPAFVFVFLEALADAGVAAGLPRAAASELATQTLIGAARLVRETGLHPAELRDRVTSPAGTTAAGLARLEARALRAAVLEAVAAATERSRELAAG